MKKLKYMLLGALISAVVSTCVALPTLSWLSSKSETVVNTFAGGTIKVRMDEAPVDAEGKKTTGDRVQNNTYKFVAGTEVDKDPTATVLKGSIPAYVFVSLENEYPDVFTYTVSSDWLEVGKKNNKTVYVYKNIVDASSSDEDVALTPLFTTVKVSEELTSQQLEAMKEVCENGQQLIRTQTYAIQSQVIEKKDAINQAAAQFEITGTTLNYDVNVT